MLLSLLLRVRGKYISMIKVFQAEKITRKGLYDFQKLPSVWTLMSPNSDEKLSSENLIITINV